MSNLQSSAGQPGLAGYVDGLPNLSGDETLIADHFSLEEPGIFEPLRGALLTHADQFMHLADLTSYFRADGSLCQLYLKPDEWAQKVILNRLP